GSTGGRLGMGAGGAVNLRVRTLAGRGTIEADGGTRNGSDNAGGGGGRIAVRTLDRDTFDPAGITARGGDGFYADGAEGTVFLLGEGESVGALVINGNGPGSPETNLLIPPGATFDSLVLQNGANVQAEGLISLAGALTLRDGSRLTHPAADESCLVLQVREIEIDATSEIDVSGRGYPGGAAAQPGITFENQPGSDLRDGGSHGGVGSDDTTFVGRPAGVYGDLRQPTTLGGGGGGPTSGGSVGGAGGGCVRIIAASFVDVDGAIRANGDPASTGGRVGMGAGGSIWIDTSRVGGEGVIQANGGTRAGADNAGGGGGRVALYYDFVDPLADLAGLRNVTAYGGDGFYADGAPGSVYLQSSTQDGGTWIADAGRATGTWAPEATLLEIGPGQAVAVTANSLTGDGGRVFVPGTLVGRRLNPDTTQAENFLVLANDAATLTVATPNENGVDFAAVASVGATYAGPWAFDEVVLRGGVIQQVADPLTVAGTLLVSERSVLTHPQTLATPSYEAALDVFATRIEVTSDSAIDVDARGYEGGFAGLTGFTVGNVRAIAGLRDGGSHGGVGGDDPTTSATAEALYGSPTDPRDLGAGGNGATSGGQFGGDGGGRVFLVATDLQIDGRLSAEGGLPSSNGRIGMGAGGTLNLDVGRLDGTGEISADGGDLAGSNNAGGGGGRIAIRISQGTDFDEGAIHAFGGDGFYADGGHGSIYLLRPGQSFGDFILDGGGLVNPEDSSEIPTGVTFDNVYVRAGVRVVNAGGLVVDGALRLEDDAVLTHASADEACLVIDATDFSIDATSAIDVTGRGYPGGTSGQRGTTLGGLPGAALRYGGSHGGLGGIEGSQAGGPGPVYGDPRRPSALGSGGGGLTSGGTLAGAGGGCVRVRVTNTLRVDGAIRANGSTAGGGGRIGMGSGGSIWLESSLLGGDGRVEANGGTLGGSNNTGGGGGRVALYYDALDPLSDLGGLRDVTAYGGDGFYGDGAQGTVYVRQTGAPFGELVSDAGRTTDTWTPEGSLPQVGPGIAGATTTDTLTLDGGREVVPGGLVGVRLNPDVAQGESFVIAANDETSVTVVTPNENGASFATIATPGATYAADWRFDAVTLRGGATLQLADPLGVTGELALSERSVLTHPFTTATPSYEADLSLDVGALSIDVDSAIDVTGRGYPGGGSGSAGFGLGNVPSGAGLRDGGSHGGLGGDDPSRPGAPGPVYGDAVRPRTLGGGGSGPTSGGAIAGAGGGRIRVVASGDVTIDGVVRADGGLPSSFGQIGMGAGGSVTVETDRLLGNGSISADGGDVNGANNAGGGGGRVGLDIGSANALPAANVTATGGDGFYADGADGTVVISGP
ncbi:MAG: hypothetical protein AAGC67_20365, partial [Myxococcota bacterium]